MYGSETNCPKCGNVDTRIEHGDIRNDSLEEATVGIICDDCGNTGTADMRPSDISWDEDGDEDGDEDEE